MNKQHHFVISFDESTGKWEWDTDSEEARFDNRTIYNHDTKMWTSGYLGDGNYEQNEEELAQQLKQALWTMNLVNGKADEDE